MATKKKELREVTDEKVRETRDSLATVREKIEALKDLEGTLERRLLDLLGEESAKVGDGEVIVSRGARQLDASALEKDFPAAKRPELYVTTTTTKLDVKAVREHFAPAVLTSYLKEPGKPSVKLS
jgi:hypothetical protein